MWPRSSARNRAITSRTIAGSELEASSSVSRPAAATIATTPSATSSSSSSSSSSSTSTSTLASSLVQEEAHASLHTPSAIELESISDSVLLCQLLMLLVLALFWLSFALPRSQTISHWQRI
ncbi:hypothetical protein ACLKA7_016847 [Drosophila subpalustris]